MKIVLDTDMCDALGVNVVLIVYKYSTKNGFHIEDMIADKYIRNCADSSVCHTFEKISDAFPFLKKKGGG